ncbi:F0F1 ATP synthase subunit B family protein [Sphingomonas nostoxanthinifaciens]|uniref:F0F1 ATP synthase subunit B family protein n=1 Tax=Sphingomonas nostoxanthinifaciens TaxID=2872652 RepID=UPI001CC1EDC3|nr:F0F1 ATP synthase subunit B [Sphingomonas nostoxanthinifaciens]UAK23527.1 F0F1 ATP synthase subunit B [Sphingomonas nostoxanthinifaciens]
MNNNLTASTVANPGQLEHEDSALGLSPGGWVALSMIVVVVIMLVKGVPGLIARGLDKKIATIRQQLDEATRLRAEAEALRAEYQAKAAAADGEAAAIVGRATDEANSLLAKAKADSELLVERRTRLAEEKITAAERTAVAEVRARAAAAATAAAAAVIAEQLDAGNDKTLVDRTIAGLGQRLN